VAGWVFPRSVVLIRAWLNFLTDCTDFQAWTFRADLARVDRSTRPGPRAVIIYPYASENWSVRLAARLRSDQRHEVDYADDASPQLRETLPQDQGGCNHLHGHDFAGTGEDNVAS
jgi:hypothetical protein